MKCISCGSDNVKQIGRYCLDCGCSGEYCWIRRRCPDCGKITMERVRVDEEIKEPSEVKKPPKTRRKYINQERKD